jgi:hypothetical protein
MTEYKIIPDGLKGYGVEVSYPHRLLSVRGFVTELDAASWIAEQQASEASLAAAVVALDLTRACGPEPDARAASEAHPVQTTPRDLSSKSNISSEQ